MISNISVDSTRELDLFSSFTITVGFGNVHNGTIIPDFVVILAILVVCS